MTREQLDSLMDERDGAVFLRNLAEAKLGIVERERQQAIDALREIAKPGPKSEWSVVIARQALTKLGEKP